MKTWALLVAAICLACVSTAAAQTAVERVVVCSGMEGREPVGISETFPAGTLEVVAFAQLTDVDCNCTVSFVWIRNGVEVRTIIVPVSRESRWRTWARKSVEGQPGDWAVEIRDAQNRPLGSTMFRVE
jgi:hypothetical protein